MIRSFFVLTILTGGIVLASAASLHADDGAMDKMYGNGVHAFFSGDYAMAHDCLSHAIDAKTKDPRCFYFRGLAYLKMGRAPEAKADFASGSDLESVDVYKFYNVSKSLERVQGKSRMEIEQYRAKARLKASAEAKKLRKARYEQLRDTENRVLKQQAAAAPAASEVPAVKPAATKAAADPFSAGPLDAPTAKAAAKPAVAKPAAPAAKPAAPIAKPAAPAADQDDPFAEAPAEPVKPEAAKPEPAKPAAAKKSGGILGAIGKAVEKTAKGATSSLPGLGEKADKPAAKAPAAANDDPFGAAPAAPAAKKPAAKAPAAADDDPFGATPAAAPAAKKPAAKAPAAADDDPFGAAPAAAPAAKKPAAKAPAADDDPFGVAPAAAPTAKKPAAKAPAAADDDPFGAAPAKPAAKMPAAAADDPFGDATPAKPAGKKPAAKKPAAKKPETKPEEIDPDDPFA